MTTIHVSSEWRNGLPDAGNVTTGVARYPAAAPSEVTYGGPVPHEAANIQCYAPLGERKDFDSGITYHLLCKKRAGHPTPKDEAPHIPVDTRILASPARVVHGRRFAPGGIPKGVDQSITLPHDCANHLRDVEEVARGY
jgi:hypothetical protein